MTEKTADPSANILEDLKQHYRADINKRLP